MLSICILHDTSLLRLSPSFIINAQSLNICLASKDGPVMVVPRVLICSMSALLSIGKQPIL